MNGHSCEAITLPFRLQPPRDWITSPSLVMLSCGALGVVGFLVHSAETAQSPASPRMVS